MAIQNQQELDFEKQLEHYKATQIFHQISVKGTLDYAASAIRGALLLNGAGAIALMTFIGSHLSTEWQAATLSLSLATFAIGAAFAVLSAGASYFSQAFFSWAMSKAKTVSAWGLAFQGIGVLCYAASLASFSLGLWRTARAFNGDFSLSSILGL